LLAAHDHSWSGWGHAGSRIREAVDGAAAFPTDADAAHGTLGIARFIDAKATLACREESSRDALPFARGDGPPFE